MKKSLIFAGAASLAVAMFAAGCAELENAAKAAQNAASVAHSRLAYQHVQERLRTDMNYEEAYKKYQSEKAKYLRDNQGKNIADDAILPYMAYLSWAAATADNNLPEKFEDFQDNNSRWMNEYFTNKKWNDCIKCAEETIKTAQNSIKLNNEELKKLQHRAAIVDEATANKKHMLNQYSFENNKQKIDKKIKECKKYIADVEKHISDAQSKIAKARNMMNSAKKLEEETEKNLKNPAFLYPKKNICSSSVPLWRDFKSGMNCLVLRKMKLVNDARTPALVDSISVIGGGYRHEEKIGEVTFIYAREAMTPANTGVLIGLLFNATDKKMEKALIEKYKKELPGAVITRKTIQKEKRSYKNYFTRCVLEHVVKFQKGAKVVQIIRREHKTVFTNAFRRLSPDYQKYITDIFHDPSYAKKERKARAEVTKALFGSAFASDSSPKFSKGEFYNCENVSCAVKIYDEQQMKAYHKFYLKYKKDVEIKKAKNQQQKLNF